ncbi:MAG: HAD family hydrolase [Clostridia bacterium]|nr:HAD family hydrolase [Clostridia bacterium]
MQRDYTHIIWDFNGTLLDDVAIGVVCANRLLRAHDLPEIPSVSHYRELFGFPIVDYYRRLGFDFDKLPYAELAKEWVSYYLSYREEMQTYADVPAALSRVRQAGLCQLILSATEKEMLKGQVEALGILPYFDELLGLENIQAFSKEEIGCRWRATHPEARVLMIGDTDHDAQVAAAMGVDCVLLTCGHQNRKTLESQPCLFVADSATEALDRVLGD